jgi:hypothetical protein
MGRVQETITSPRSRDRVLLAGDNLRQGGASNRSTLAAGTPPRLRTVGLRLACSSSADRPPENVEQDARHTSDADVTGPLRTQDAFFDDAICGLALFRLGLMIPQVQTERLRKRVSNPRIGEPPLVSLTV